jgi:hypothetical protein
VLAARLQQIQMQPGGREPLEAALARGHDAVAGGLRGGDLADQERVVAEPFDGSADQLLGAAVGVALGGVGQAEVEP